MLGIVRSVRSVAEAADRALLAQGAKPKDLKDAANQLRSCFAAAQQATGASVCLSVCGWVDEQSDRWTADRSMEGQEAIVTSAEAMPQRIAACSPSAQP
jgi:hypothetical protein